MEPYDVIVAGGGPAGLMAAGRAAECGRRVLLLEKNRRPGEKLRLSGGGRCNITNAEFDTRALLAHYGDAAKFLHSTFARFSVRDTFEFFESRGLPFEVEDRNRAFPKSRKAADVVRVLEAYLRDNGGEIRTGCAVRGLLLEEGRLAGVQTDGDSIRAESVILSTGGVSYPETGSTGDGFDWLRRAGHTVAEATPDIVPLRVREAWVKNLSGTVLEPMRITFTARDGETLVREGKLLFTHFGISGPLILNSAHAVKELLKQGPVAGSIDLFPGLEPPAVDRQVLQVLDANRNKLVRSVVRLLVPAGMGRVLAEGLEPELLEKKVNTVTQEERRAIIRAARSLPLTVTGTMGYDWAVICDGGVPLEEMDTRTMASRRIPNLYIIGDLLHVSRPSGGFSLQLCWTTGFVAGSNA